MEIEEIIDINSELSCHSLFDCTCVTATLQVTYYPSESKCQKTMNMLCDFPVHVTRKQSYNHYQTAANKINNVANNLNCMH